MGYAILSFDEESSYCRYWPWEDNPNRPTYVPALDDINRYPVKEESSPLIIESGDVIKVIMVIQEGNVKALHSTTGLE